LVSIQLELPANQHHVSAHREDAYVQSARIMALSGPMRPRFRAAAGLLATRFAVRCVNDRSFTIAALAMLHRRQAVLRPLC